jgi:plastocyanin
MKRLCRAVPVLAILLSPLRLHAATHAHCAPCTLSAVPGDPGSVRITTAHGSTIAHRAAHLLTSTPVAVCRVFSGHFDFDGDTLGTERDTIVVAVGTTVSWIQIQPAFHTVTNGSDSGDPNAASEFNQVLDGTTTRFDWTYTTAGKHDFFCYIHEPVMEGTVMVVTTTADVPPGVIRKATFSRPPAPNPARGDVSFAVALPRAMPVQISVLDVEGRRIARIEDAPLGAGEHPFRWNGRADSGAPVGSGRYFIRFAAGGSVETRAVSLIR